tara:strand:- start:53 stop:1405 length:1353 start_codon:yes stop_codon:yes gene_type:complete
MSFSTQLNYSRKPKAVASRSTRLNVYAANGNSWLSGQTITINLPQLPRSYYNLREAVLKFKVAPTGAGHLQQSAYSVINSFTTSTNNGVIDKLEGYGVYNSIIMDAQLDPQVAVGVGSLTMGMGGNTDKIKLGKGVSTTTKIPVCLPLYHGLFNTDRSFPADTSSPLRFDIKLATPNEAFIRTAHGTEVSEFTITDLEFIVDVTELSPDAEVVLASTFPDFNITFEAISHTTTTKSNAGTQLNENLGCRYSSVNKITACMRPQIDIGTAGVLSSVNRTSGKIDEIAYRINGQQVPQKSIKVDTDFSEVVCENLKAWGDLGSRLAPSSLQTQNRTDTTDADNEATTTVQVENFKVEDLKFVGSTPDAVDIAPNDANIGTFFTSLDLNTMPAITDSSALYSGVSTLGSGIITDFKFSSTPASNSSDLLLDFWIQYTSVLNIDPVSKSVFVSV